MFLGIEFFCHRLQNKFPSIPIFNNKQQSFDKSLMLDADARKIGIYMPYDWPNLGVLKAHREWICVVIGDRWCQKSSWCSTGRELQSPRMLRVFPDSGRISSIPNKSYVMLTHGRMSCAVSLLIQFNSKCFKKSFIIFSFFYWTSTVYPRFFQYYVTTCMILKLSTLVRKIFFAPLISLCTYEKVIIKDSNKDHIENSHKDYSYILNIYIYIYLMTLVVKLIIQYRNIENIFNITRKNFCKNNTTKKQRIQCTFVITTHSSSVQEFPKDKAYKDKPCITTD